MSDPREAADPGTTRYEAAPGQGGVTKTFFRYRYRDGRLRSVAPDQPAEPAGEDTPTFALPGTTVSLPYGSDQVRGRIGGYDLLEELGRGGMGVVYRAYAVNLGRFVAVKLITADTHAPERMILRFHNEARLAGRLQHPHIVPVHDSGEEAGRHYFVMALIEGQDLGRWLGDPSQVDFSFAARALAKVARALDFAHRQGVIHRDVKPGNILLDREGEPHLADFGLAKRLADSLELTSEGVALGTPHYMPPEQANGELRHLGPHSDVYALGATLYHVLAGRVPFKAANFVAVLTQVVKKEPEPPGQVRLRELGQAAPDDLQTICLKAMEKEAARRYPSAVEMALDLERFAAGEPILSTPIGRLERLARYVRRRRSVLAAACVGLAFLAVVTLAFAALAVHTVRRSSASLREKDLADARSQAATLERAIRVNMLQGRADLARELVQKLSADKDAGEIQVARTDRTLAYTDLATRRAVERRLADPAVVREISRRHPDLAPKLDVLRTLGFAGIELRPGGEALTVDVDRDQWDLALRAVEVRTYVERRAGVPHLVVLRPIANSPQCQACHGEIEGYARQEKVRAVLVVRRSQAAIEAAVAANCKAAIVVGGGTLGALALLAFVAWKLLGLSMRRMEFGMRAPPTAAASTQIVPPPAGSP